MNGSRIDCRTYPSDAIGILRVLATTVHLVIESEERNEHIDERIRTKSD